jgi:hypothetical protein
VAAAPEPASLPEPELNELLRRVDWRFLLSQPEAPRVARPAAGRSRPGLAQAGGGRAIGLVASGPAAGAGEADLALTGFPSRAGLAAAVESLRPEGEIVCAWRVPRIAGARRARRRLRDAGFADVTVHWPGPLPWRAPQFWLPLGSPAATAYLLRERPPRTRVRALLRPLWHLAAGAGLLAPLYAVARLPGAADRNAGGGRDDSGGELSGPLPAGAEQLLLTGGGRSINKVVALPFADDAPAPGAVVKFARVAAADAALDREAVALRALAEEHPGVAGVPRLLAQERRVGRRALAESAVPGEPLIAALRPATFGELAAKVSAWLTGLVEDGEPRPPSQWWQRLVGEPLAAFERDFSGAVEAGTVERLRTRLRGLDSLPLRRACEHRDCSPWNVVLGAAGAPGLLDWESAEPHGLPGLDLAYFLANSAFVLDGAIETGRTRESYRRLLDPTTPYGREAAARVVDYCARVGLDPDAFATLRLLAWVVHARSDYLHREMAAAGPPSPDALRTAPYLGLVETELTLPR